jgi:hypothetical protein
MRDMGLTPKKMVLKRAIFKQLQYAVKAIKRQELVCQTSLTKYIGWVWGEWSEC